MKRINLLKLLVVLAGSFLLSVPTAKATVCSADINCNGRIDGGDMFALVDEANDSLRNCDPSTQCLNCAGSGMIECGFTCVDNNTDESNCGSCGNACQYGEICYYGNCYDTGVGCPTGLIECAATCIDPMIDRNYCGASEGCLDGIICGDGEICVSGVCEITCQPYLTDCSGTCVDANTDEGNCGSCGIACASGEVCDSGSCVVNCPLYLTECSDKCVDNSTDEGNCGSCDNECQYGETCYNGVCFDTGGGECPPGLMDCAATCVDNSTDEGNCGSCGNTCQYGEICIGGACFDTGSGCPPELIDCDGTCKDNSTDENNCGSCGIICEYGEICYSGTCYVVCEGCGCPPGLTDCGGTCEDNSTDYNNCGSCGNRCASWEICFNGTCDNVCEVDEIRCGSTCVDNSTDEDNCGSCGNVCQGGRTCIDGACVCQVYEIICDNTCVDNSTDEDNCGSCGNVCQNGGWCIGGICYLSPASLYYEIDVSGGPGAATYPVTELPSQPPLTDDYKTTKILLRKIDVSGTPFLMGTPDDEHLVTLTQDYYIGVFEITQRQYELVMGGTPSAYAGDMRPVEQVSCYTIRGGVWPGSPPGSGQPAPDTFIDKLRSKAGLNFDLPTEAQWEYAARATTIRAFNDYTKNGGEGADCTVPDWGADPGLDPLGRYWYNGGDTSHHAIVGTYQPNLWGLYDMHGNVWEWCLDWYGSYSGDTIDPLGPGSGPGRLNRGGSWGGYGAHAKFCRSDARTYASPSSGTNDLGFRLALPQ